MRAGGVLADRYRLTARLATGGMGEVWAADDGLLGRRVAVKVVKPEYADDPAFRQRLHAEAKAAASVRDPHVVSVYDIGEAADGEGRMRSYIVMELVDGRSMADVMRDGPASAEATRELLVDVGEALAAAHACGVVHRDIKPANLMCGPGGRITVLDFGIARAADAASLTMTGMVLGTARYMSPEQASGRSATAASDVYSLGVVAYHCLAGRPPFDAGSDVATALAHREEPVPPLPSHVPPALAALVLRCLAKRPEDRPTAAAVAEAARALRQPAPAVEPTLAMAPSPTRVLTAGGADADLPVWLRWRTLAVAGAVGVALVGLITALALAGGSHPAAGRTHAAAGTRPSAKTLTASTAGPDASSAAAGDVTVRPASYVGEAWSQARRRLDALGVRPQRRAVTTTAQRAGRVAAIAPAGRVRTGSPVTVSVAVAPASPAPAAAKPATHAPTRHKPAPHRPAPHRPAPRPHGRGPGGHGPPGHRPGHGGG